MPDATTLGDLWKELKSVGTRALFYSTLVAIIGSVSFGYGNGFSSPALPDLDKKITYFNRTIYHDLFNGLSAVGSLLGAPLAGWLVDRSGRQFTMVLCSFPFTIGWLLILITNGITGPLFKPLLFAGRFITGLGIGSVSLVVPLYIAEISPKNLRGLFGNMNQLAITVGILLVQALGIGLSYEWLSLIGLVITLLFVTLTSMTLRESPRWLISQGKNSQANKVLLWLRGCNSINLVIEEKTEIESQLVKEIKQPFTEQIKALKARPVYHPLILAVLLMFFQQFSGINAVVFNGELILEDAGVGDAAVMATITIGVTQVVGSLVGAILMDILGRKVLLMISGITMCLSMGLLSIYFSKNEPLCSPPTDSKCKDNLYPLAITAMMFYIIGYAIGWGALPWLMASELIPMKARGIGVGIATCVNWICAAIVLGFFGSYEDLVKPWGAFLTFSIICLSSVIFVGVFIPETKGKSLEQIEEIFNKDLKHTDNKEKIPLLSKSN